MSSKYSEAVYLAAGVSITKWRNDNSTFPIMIYDARERYNKAFSDAVLPIKATSAWTNADAATQKQLLETAEQHFLNRRHPTVLDWRLIARNLGHQEVDGKFVFEGHSDGKASRQQPNHCEYCGLASHDVPACKWYLMDRHTKLGYGFLAAATNFEGSPTPSWILGATFVRRIANDYETLTPRAPVTIHPAPEVPLPINVVVLKPGNGGC